MAKKVLLVIARMNVSGTATYLNNLVRSSQDLEIEHLIVLGSVQGEEVEDRRVLTLSHIRIISLGRKINFLSDFKSWIRLRQIIKTYKNDVINSHTFKAGLIVTMLPTRIPNLHTFNGRLLNQPEFSFLKRQIILGIERILYKRASALSVTGTRI